MESKTPTSKMLGILKPTDEKVPSQHALAQDKKFTFGFFSHIEICLLRDNFQLTTWLAIGCGIQAILSCLIGDWRAYIPAFLLLLSRAIDTLLVVRQVKPNKTMKDVIQGRYTARVPATDGSYTNEKDICVFNIAARSNSPLGIFAPGYKELGEYFNNFVKLLDANPDEYGWLGGTSFLECGTQNASNQILMIGYFRNIEGLHKFAQGKEHREGWSWWERTVKEHGHIGISHEAYMVPAGNWESIYVNYQPTMLGGISSKIKFVEADGTVSEKWVGSPTRSSKVAMSSSLARMGRVNVGI